MEIRPIRREEHRAYSDQMTMAFGGTRVSDEFLAAAALSLEFDRTLAAFEGSELLATAGAHTFRLSVPGGDVPTAGVTRVTVRPTHRRQGILTAMMRRQMDDFHAAGEPLAALYASEAPIYGRFGYGVGTLAADVELTRARAAFALAPGAGGRVRLVDREEAERLAPAVYERYRAGHPGAPWMPAGMWTWYLSDRPERRPPGASELVLASYEEEGRPEGYLWYRLRSEWSGEGPRLELMISQLIAATPAAYEALWRYCLGVDLVVKVSGHRPVFEPLPLMLKDRRALRSTMSEGIWLRLVDVAAALAGRAYSTDGSLTFAVRDSFCPWNEGEVRLEGGPDGSRCVPAAGGEDLALGAASLAAAYLGATSFADLAGAGLVDELRPGALKLADDMFRVQPPAWCPFHF